MRQLGSMHRKPLAAAVLAVVLAFAVVCPLMAAPGVPADQGCHSSSEPAPGEERASVCCSSVTVPKLLAPGPGLVAALPASFEAAPDIPRWNHPSDGPLPFRKLKPPLFVQHAALLI